MDPWHRREEFRIPVQMSINEHTDWASSRCMTVNLGPKGLFINRLLRKMQHEDEQSVVGLEFQLPDSTEVIWAKGEIRYHEENEFFHGTGVEITAIARKHQNLISEYVNRRRREHLRGLLASVKRNRKH